MEKLSNYEKQCEQWRLTFLAMDQEALRRKLPELEALEMAYKAIQEGAHGVDMGRNIFQSDSPAGMAQAIGRVVHEGFTPAQAYEVYQEVKNQR